MRTKASANPRRRWRRGALTAVLLAVAPPSVFACGYENPSAMALGMLNWSFPEALHVRTAVWQAEQAGILPARPAAPVKDIFGNGFRRAAMSMNVLGGRLNANPATRNGPSFSVVLIPAVMWTTYAPTSAGYSVQVHADGPAKGDVVIVTDEKVVRALVDGSLDAAAAEKLGLLRFYGPAEAQDRVRAALAGWRTAAGEDVSALPTGTSDGYPPLSRVGQ